MSNLYEDLMSETLDGIGLDMFPGWMCCFYPNSNLSNVERFMANNLLSDMNVSAPFLLHIGGIFTAEKGATRCYFKPCKIKCSDGIYRHGHAFKKVGMTKPTFIFYQKNNFITNGKYDLEFDLVKLNGGPKKPKKKKPLKYKVGSMTAEIDKGKDGRIFTVTGKCIYCTIEQNPEYTPEEILKEILLIKKENEVLKNARLYIYSDNESFEFKLT